MWLYNLLDIASTATEMLVLYVMIKCFCKEPRFPIGISKIIPPAVYLISVVIVTFFTDLGAIKVFIFMILMVLLTKFCYVVSFSESLVVMELSYLFIIVPEAVSLSLINLIYDGNIIVTVEGVFILRWQIYVAGITLRCLLLAVAYRLLHNFAYHVHPKDVAVLSVSFLLAFCVSFASEYVYWNLQIGNTFSLDLVSLLCSIYFIVQFLYVKNVSCLREQEQRDKMKIAQLQRQFTYYQDKRKDEERVRSIYHDLKNHLLLLESKQNTEETRQMAEKLRSQIADYENYVHTGNEFLDIIIRDKAKIAQEKQIDFNAIISFEDGSFIELLDISTIFGNALDNAIEASEKLPEARRLITVRAKRVRDMLVITVENNVTPDLSILEGTTKEDAFVHGFGLPNIQNAAEHYGGQCSVKVENGMFVLKILIPIP